MPKIIFLILVIFLVGGCASHQKISFNAATFPQMGVRGEWHVEKISEEKASIFSFGEKVFVVPGDEVKIIVRIGDPGDKKELSRVLIKNKNEAVVFIKSSSEKNWEAIFKLPKNLTKGGEKFSVFIEKKNCLPVWLGQVNLKTGATMPQNDGR
ncbi:MAG: hypothetical protein ABIE14_05510 [Patescibacteria group bacterium]